MKEKTAPRVACDHHDAFIIGPYPYLGSRQVTTEEVFPFS